MKVNKSEEPTGPGGVGAGAANRGKATSPAGAQSTERPGAADFASILDKESRPPRADAEGDEGAGRSDPGSGRARPGEEQGRESRVADEGEEGGSGEGETDERTPSGRTPEPQAGADEAAVGRPAAGHWAGPDYAAARETRGDEAMRSARDILRSGDLEQIVSSIRTHVTLEGRREVTVELTRSALEGLRIKVAADQAGRITAEFVAGSEHVRQQVESRAPELAALMRSRGIDLAALKTSSDSAASHQSGDGPGGRGRQPFQRGGTAGRAGGAPEAGGAGAETEEGAALPPAENQKTYRA